MTRSHNLARPPPGTLLTVLLGVAWLSAAAPAADIPAATAPSPTNSAVASTNAAPVATNAAPPIAADSAQDGAAAIAPKVSESRDRDSRPDRPDRDSRRSSRRGSDRRRDSSGNSSDGSTNAASTGTDFASFKIITDRNVFNPNRGRGSGRSDREAARRPVQIDLITLVGALSYTKGDFAFFDGSSSQFRKTLKCGDTIAGYTIKSIQPHSVRVEAGEKSHDLAVGSQLRREDEGEWQFIARADATAMPASGSSGSEATGTGSSASGSGSSSASPGGSAADEILQRLMRKREQEK